MATIATLTGSAVFGSAYAGLTLSQVTGRLTDSARNTVSGPYTADAELGFGSYVFEAVAIPDTWVDGFWLVSPDGGTTEYPKPVSRGDLGLPWPGATVGQGSGPFTGPTVIGLCRVDVRVRDGSGNVVSGSTITATLENAPQTVSDAILTQQVVNGTTSSDGTLSLYLIKGQTYLVRGTDPAGTVFVWRSITVPDADTADLWGLV
jgi:hypothetical protein